MDQNTSRVHNEVQNECGSGKRMYIAIPWTLDFGVCSRIIQAQYINSIIIRVPPFYDLLIYSCLIGPTHFFKVYKLHVKRYLTGRWTRVYIYNLIDHNRKSSC